MLDDRSLIAESGPDAGRRIPVPADGLSVGRAEGLGLVLHEPEVSRQHARLAPTLEGTLELTDSSVNGTFVNGHRILQPTLLQIGDQVRFGSAAAPAFTLRGGNRGAAAARAPGGGEGVRTLAVPAVEAAPACWVDLVVDQRPVQPVELGRRLILGRQAGPGRLAIPHASVSAAHAEIVPEGGAARLRDLGSRNGTLLNQEAVTEATLADGDLIQLGSCESHLLLFREAAPRTLHLTDVDVSRPRVRLGRGEDNDIRLDHPTVSHYHAEILNRRGETFIVDKGSTNGTFVNGEPVTRLRPLARGDRVHLGALEFVYDGSHLEGAEAGLVRLSAAGLRVEVRDRVQGSTKRLIDDISLVIEPRQFVGLLGGSGAGKSTLMDALNGARPAQQGTVWLNHDNLYRRYPALRAMIGYVPQDDILHQELTTRECLYFSARLRLPDDYGEAALQRKVNEVMHTLELTERAQQPVHSLSGGQRKRVSVGIELLSDPAILFLDEPTAGQDPKNEQQMMQLFRRIANRGASVIINTHLLGSFGLLDRVAVLVGGKLAYYGPAPEMLGYFNCQQPHEVYYRLKDEATPEQWGQRFRRSGEHRRYVQEALGELEEAAGPAAATAEPPSAPAKPRHGILRQAQTLWARQWSRKLKNKLNLGVLLLPPSVIAALIGLMDWPHRGADGRRLFSPNTPMSLFMLVLIALWFGCSATVREIVDEAAVYRRERQRDLNLSSYLAAKLAYLAALAGIQSGLCVAVMLALHVLAGHAVAAWVWMWVLTVQGGLIGLLISALAPSAEVALYSFPLVMIAELLFAGLLVPTAPLQPFYADVGFAPNGQVTRLALHEQPAWLPRVPPMSPLLRDSGAAVMVSRWGLEGLANLYSQDLGGLPDCMSAQQEANPADNCGYSLALTDMVAFTFRRGAGVQARDYVRNLAERMQAPAAGGSLPAWPLSSSGEEYGAIQFGFCVLMIAALAAAMRRKERSSHAA